MDYEQSIPMVPVELVEVEITTKQAAERYGCDNYSTFHNRMVKLGIKPERRGRQSFLNQQQIQLLDRLDIHLKSGGVFGNFEIEEGATRSMPESTSSDKLIANKVNLITTNGSIGDIEIIAALQSLSMKNYDILTPQKRLQEAADNDFLLTTEQVSQILGLNANTIRSWKSETRKLGFTFHKEHENSSVVWRITRSSRTVP
jgi:hypothetical protein